MNDGFIYEVFKRSPMAEVLFRNIVSYVPAIKKISQKKYNNDQHHNSVKEVKDGLWEKYKESIVNDCKIKRGDFVLVHSSFLGLIPLGVSANEIIEYLLNLVGREGTLVFPCYPDLKKMEKSGDSYIYEPEKTVPWTGKLPRTFMTIDGVIRSAYPHNTLAAKGRLAKEMFVEDILHQKHSQSVASSWDFGIKHGMKILYLGVKASTSCTIVHYAEDVLSDDYPVKNWHVQHNYIVRRNGIDTPVTTWERDDFFFKYYCMFNTGERLVKMGYLREYDVDGCYLGIMDDVEKMSAFLIDEARNKKLLFKIPRRYMK